MRAIFEDDEFHEGRDFIGNGFVNDCPYMFMINALSTNNTAVNLMQKIISQELSEFIQALKKAKNSKALGREIENSCARIFDHFQNECRENSRYNALSPVTFSLVILLPSLNEGKKLIGFGLGNSMIALARQGGFYTLKPAVLLNDGQVRGLPCSREKQAQKIAEAKKELCNYTIIMDLKPEDEVCLISRDCYQFLAQEEKLLGNIERLITLALEQESPIFRDLRNFFINKSREIKDTKAIEALKKEISLIEEQLETCKRRLIRNSFWKRNYFRMEIAKKVENKGSLNENLGIQELIMKHNMLHVTIVDQVACQDLEIAEQKLRERRIVAQQKLGDLSPEFTCVTMHVPQDDYVFFESRLNTRAQEICEVFKREHQQRFPSTKLMPESHTCLSRHYQELFKASFKDSLLGRYLILLALCDGDENFDENLKLYHLIYDLNNFPKAKLEAINDYILFLKKTCQLENLNKAEILEKLDALITFLSTSCSREDSQDQAHFLKK